MHSLNKIFRTIWSDALGAWIAVSELVKTKGKRSASSLMRVLPIGGVDAASDDIHRHRFKPATLFALCFLSFGAHGNPMGGNVVGGSASFNSSGNTLTVTNTPGTIIHWQDFSIQQNEITRFNQQSASSTVLNRVVGGNTSQILGSLQSNGRVFLVNPNGVVFGAGSTVDVAGLVATSLNLSDADFLSGRHRFTNDPNAQAVSNAGNLNAQQGGEIWLIAPDVENSGVITAPNGEILLAAGSSVELTNSLDPNLRVNITAPAGDATNIGQLVASAGRLGLFGTMVKNSGQVSADSATLQGGKIVFRSSQHTEVNGTASAQGVGGGEIKVLSDMQAGTVRVSGTLDASAPETGDGGFIDTSAAHLDIQPSVSITAAAASGKAGEWLIDPLDIIVGTAASNAGFFTGSPPGIWSPQASGSYVNAGTVAAMLDGGTSVTISTVNGGFAEAGNISVDAPINTANAGAATLTLSAENDIVINAPLNMNNSLVLTADSDTSGAGNVVVNKAVTAAAVNASGQDIVFDSLDSGSSYGQFNGGAVTLNAANIISPSLWGVSMEVVAPSLSLNAVNGIVNSGTAFVVDVSGTVSFSNVNNAVHIYNLSSASGRLFTGSNTNGMIRLESFDSAFPTTVDNLTSGGDILLRMNNLTFGAVAAVNAGANKVIISPYTISPSVLPVSLGGTDTFNLIGSDLSKIAAAVIVIGNDSFGNITPTVNIGSTTAVAIGNGANLEIWGGTINVGALGISNTLTGGQIKLVAGAGGVNGSGAISVPSLAIQSGGGVSLGGSNAVSNLAASLSDGTTNFAFNNVGNLNLSGNLAGLAGISISSFTTGGNIALSATGALTQDAGGILAGASVCAEGSRVTLNAPNPTGVIAGWVNGAGTGDIFSYNSINGINVSTLNNVIGSPVAGISTGNPIDQVTVALNAGSAGITQSAAIIAGDGTKGLSLSTTGPVNLTGSNLVGILTGVGVGSLQFVNAGGALSLGDGVNGVSTNTNQPISIQSAGDLFVQQPLAAGTGAISLSSPNLFLNSNVSGGAISLNATQVASGVISQAAGSSVVATSGLTMAADNVTFLGSMVGATAGVGNVSIAPVTSARPIEIGGTNNPSALSLTPTELAAINPAASGIVGGAFNIGVAAAGPVSFTGNYAGVGGMFTNLLGASVGQSAGTTVSGPLSAIVSGSVLLTEPTNLIDKFYLFAPGGSSLVTNVPSLSLFTTVNAGAGLSVTNTGGGIQVDATTSATVINLQSANGIDMLPGSSLSATGTGDVLVLNAGAGSFVNNGGVAALSAANGRWLVYAPDPVNVTKGGLTSAFRQYATGYGGTINTPTGNGFIYASTPVTLLVDTVLTSGVANHVYGATPTAIFGYALANATSADNEDLLLITGTPVFTPVITAAAPAGSYAITYDYLSGGLVSAAGHSFMSGASLPYTVSPAALNLMSIKANDTSKTYGTTLNFSGTEFTPVGLVGGDVISSVTLSSTGTVSTAIVGNYPISASNAIFSVGSAANYTVTYTDGVLTVIPATLTLNSVSDTKIYDGNTLSSGIVSVTGLVGSDAVGPLTQSFNSANVLGTNVSVLVVDPGYVVSDGNGGANYTVVTNSATGTINPYPVSLTGSRRYDGTNIVDASIFTIGPLVRQETLNLTGSGSVIDPNLSTGQTVILGTLALADGAGLASNYTFFGGTQTVDITPIPVAVMSITANDASKTYGTNYTFTGTEFAAPGLIGGDMISGVTISSAGAASSANVGTYPIIASNALFSVGSAANYDITYIDGTLTVMPKQLSIAGSTVANKTYDGLRSANVTPGTIAGLVGNETLGVSASGIFDTKHAGTAKPVVVTYTLSNGSGVPSNYILSGEVLGAEIAPRNITFTAPSINKTYDGTTGYVTNVADMLAFDALLEPGDLVSSINMNFADKDAGVGKMVNLNAVGINDGNGGNNYNVTLVGNNSSSISQANLVASAFPVRKEFGSPDPSLSYSVTGLFDPVSSVLNGSLSRDPGEEISNYAINQGTLALTSSNYVLTFVPNTFTIKAPSVVQAATQESLGNGTPEGQQEEEKKKKNQELADAEAGNGQSNGLPENLPVCR